MRRWGVGVGGVVGRRRVGKKVEGRGLGNGGLSVINRSRV